MARRIPAGWYGLAASDEVGPETVLARRLGRRQRVLFRSGGRIALVGPTCPHLGAHLAHGGRVVGGALRCPFHGLRFGPDGACLDPRGHRLALRTFPVMETGGWVLGWFAPDRRPPTWTPPPLDLDGYTPLRTETIELRAHPEDTTENSVDLAHFSALHGYRDVRLHDLTVDGPHLHARYSFVRPEGVPLLARDLAVEMDVHAWGLGFSYVDVKMPAIGLCTRQYVLPTPVGGGRVELRLGMALARDAGTRAWIRWLPAWIFGGIVASRAMRGYVEDVLADRDVWEHRRWLREPGLVQGDGPIARYRAWCRQFHPAPGASAPGART